MGVRGRQEVRGDEEVVEHQVGGRLTVEADAAGAPRRDEDVFGPILREEVFDLCRLRGVRLARADADEAAPLRAQAVEEGGAEEGRAAGDEDARGGFHDASAVMSEETSSRNGSGASQARSAGSYSFCGS